MNATMNNWRLTVILADDTRESIVAYPANLSAAQVRAYAKRRCQKVHGRNFVTLAVADLGPSDVRGQRGMV